MFGLLGGLFIYAFYILVFTKSLPLKEIMTIDEVDIEEHNNNPHTLFKRGTNSFFDGTTLADAKALINTFANQRISKLVLCCITYLIG